MELRIMRHSPYDGAIHVFYLESKSKEHVAYFLGNVPNDAII